MSQESNSSAELHNDDTKQVLLKLSSVSGLFLMGIMAAILYMVLAVVDNFADDKRMPKALSGQINLQAIELNEGLTVPLSGEWLFAWNALLEPKELFALTSSKTPSASLSKIQVPSSWGGMSINGEALPSQGYATYHLRVKLKKQYDNLSLYVPPIGTAHRLYVNNQLVSSQGQVGKTSTTSSPDLSAAVFNLSDLGSDFSITLQVSNFDYLWSGQWSTLRIGAEQTIHQEQYRKILQATFIIAVFFTISLFNLIQFSLRPEHTQPFIIAVIAMLLGLRELEFSFILELANIYDFSFELGTKINFITFFLTPMPILLYFYLRLKEDMNAHIVYFICAISSIFTIMALFSSPVFFSQFATYYQIFCLFIISFIVFGLIKAVIKKRENANVLLLGTLVLFSFLVNDILLSLGAIESVVLINFGLVAFVMCQNYLTYTYFINAGVENKILNIDLSKKNKSLEELSNNLERQVAERTEDLEQANRKLEHQVNEDPLTCLLNRRGLAPYFERARGNYEDMGLTFSVMVIDFDNFKNLNDTQGHDVGDIVLESGGLLMKSIVKSPAVVGRWGGEEFIVVCPSLDIQEARKIGEALRKEIHFCLTQEINYPVSITIGVAEIRENESTDNCIKRADEALYQGKQNGRNRVELAL